MLVDVFELASLQLLQVIHEIKRHSTNSDENCPYLFKTLVSTQTAALWKHCGEIIFFCEMSYAIFEFVKSKEAEGVSVSWALDRQCRWPDHVKTEKANRMVALQAAWKCFDIAVKGLFGLASSQVSSGATSREGKYQEQMFSRTCCISSTLYAA
nr:uncharacterized protein LOC129383695 isoform X2 [Dermacentor andersoni]